MASRTASPRPRDRMAFVSASHRLSSRFPPELNSVIICLRPKIIKRNRTMRAQIVLLLLGIAVTGSNSLVLSPILADVALGLGTTPVAVSRALAAYGGATALSAFLLAPRIDRVGPRRALTAGMAALTARHSVQRHRHALGDARACPDRAPASVPASSCPRSMRSPRPSHPRARSRRCWAGCSRAGPCRSWSGFRPRP